MDVRLGKCALCLETKELRDSHFLPAAVWRRARESSRTADPNPILVAAGKAFSSSRQVTAYLLSGDCEQMLSMKGESHVLSQCARPDGRFPLREALERTTPTIEDEELGAYDAQGVLGGAVDDHLYFAASVFWRAAAHSWAFGSHRIEKLEIGNKYTEEFRLYLCGQASFPANARLFVHVSSESSVEMTSIFPCSFRLEGARRHKFYIPGMLFILFLGGDVPTKHDALALNSIAGGFIWLCPWRSDSLFRGFVKQVAQAGKSGTLNRRQ